MRENPLAERRKHLDLQKGTNQIQQRHCRGDIDDPKTKNGRRVLTLGALVARYGEWVSKKNINHPEQWLFPQDYYPEMPMWDSGFFRANLQA